MSARQTANGQIIASRYTKGTRFVLSAVGIVGIGLLAAAYDMNPAMADRVTLLLGVTMMVIWACTLLDAISRKIWAHDDRLVYRNLFGRRTTLYYGEVISIKQGPDRFVVTAARGQSLTVLRRMEHYNALVALIASKTQHIPSTVRCAGQPRSK